MDFVTLKQLNRALSKVFVELDYHGFLDESLAGIDVYLVAFSGAYGKQYYRSKGDIHIPAVSLSRLGDIFHGKYTSLRDVVRHEYGHAVADTHRGLMRSRRFSDTFGASHDSETEWEFDPEHHVTEYAATNPSEDFAEVFMMFLKFHGKMPSKYHSDIISGKWKFVEELGDQIKNGHRKWV